MTDSGSVFALAIDPGNTTNVGSLAVDPGHLRMFPVGSPLPMASSLNFNAGQTRANNGLLPLGDSGAIAARADTAATRPTGTLRAGTLA